MDSWSAARSEEGRAQGRNERPMRREQKRLEKADRQRRAAERRLQASRPNHPGRVEDSGLRGCREFFIRSELTSSEPPGSKPDCECPCSYVLDYGCPYSYVQEGQAQEAEDADYEEASDDGKKGDSDSKIPDY